jgi:hypothetical protein
MIVKNFRCLACAAAFALVAITADIALAQHAEHVHFAAGNDNAAVESAVKGNAYRDYILGAKAGQTMGVSLITKGSAYFNILPPGSTGEAIYNGSIDGADASIKLPSDGNYTIRVYLMGNDKDAGKTVPFTLSMTIM